MMPWHCYDDGDHDDRPGVGDDDVTLPALGEAAPGAQVIPAVVGAPAVIACEDLTVALTIAQSVLTFLAL